MDRCRCELTCMFQLFQVCVACTFSLDFFLRFAFQWMKHFLPEHLLPSLVWRHFFVLLFYDVLFSVPFLLFLFCFSCYMSLLWVIVLLLLLSFSFFFFFFFLLGITLYRWCSAFFFFFFSFFWNWVIVVSTNIRTYCLVIWTFSLNHAWLPSKISDFVFFLSAASLNEFKGLVRFAEQKEKRKRTRISRAYRRIRSQWTWKTPAGRTESDDKRPVFSISVSPANELAFAVFFRKRAELLHWLPRTTKDPQPEGLIESTRLQWCIGQYPASVIALARFIRPPADIYNVSKTPLSSGEIWSDQRAIVVVLRQQNIVG